MSSKDVSVNITDNNNIMDGKFLQIDGFTENPLLFDNNNDIFRCSSICNGACSSLVIPETPYNAYNVFHSLYKSGELCDAVLRTEDGEKISVHRFVLTGDSDYFRALFTTSLHVEAKHDIIINNIGSGMLKTLIEFVYSRTITMTENTVCEILQAADYLGIVKLKNACSKFIESKIDAENCLGIRKYARGYFCEELWRAAHQYLMLNFIPISETSEEFLELPPDEVMQIFGDDHLNVKSEEPVWRAAMRWIKFDEENRTPMVVGLLSRIRTGLMDTEYFMEKVKDHPYVYGRDSCRPIVIETLRFLYDLEVITERTGEIQTPTIARPRIPHEVLFAIGGWSGSTHTHGTPTNFIETYDTRADRWIRVEEVDPLGPRAYHGMVTWGFEIIMFGGFDGTMYFNSTRAFNAVTKTWRNLSPMHYRRCYVSSARLDNYVYAMGGYDGVERLHTAERYDPVANQWFKIPNMHARRSDSCATTFKGRIFITGGFNGLECLNSNEVYNPETKQWTVIAPMHVRRSGVSCIAYHNHIYVLGGFNGISRLCSAERYNPITNSWTSIPDMYNPRSNFAVEVIDDMIFCIGGFNGVTTIYHVECFDDENNEWYEATDMNIYRSALAACTISGLPNINDYIHQHRERLMEEKRQRLIVLQQQQIQLQQNQNRTNQ